MSSIKLAATALLAVAFLTQASVAAMAEDSNSDDDSTSFIAPTSRPLNPAPNERTFHGDRPKHKKGEKGEQFQVAVPPMVITPDQSSDDETGEQGVANPKRSFKVSPPMNGAVANSSVSDTAGNEQVIEPNSAIFDPNANKPIQMQNINPNKKTPADVFIESAQIGVGAMAAGAAVLGVTAAVRGARFRRQAQTDFIYEVDTKE